MKTISILISLTVLTMGCQCSTSNAQNKNSIISRVYHAKGDHETDTLWVSQNDTTVFKAEETIQRRRHQDAVLVMQYELRNPRDGAYYFIYNEDQQLIQEGVYTASYTYEGRINKQGDFYNVKNYRYNHNGSLEAIHYQEDGRNLKIEFYDQNRQLTQITWFNKKSSDKEKVEFYKNGKPKETRIYTAFDTYYTLPSTN